MPWPIELSGRGSALAAEAPFLLVVAGPNGSGKTTLTNQLRADGVDFGRYINPMR